jgi:hypothetical protein
MCPELDSDPDPQHWLLRNAISFPSTKLTHPHPSAVPVDLQLFFLAAWIPLRISRKVILCASVLKISFFVLILFFLFVKLGN